MKLEKIVKLAEVTARKRETEINEIVSYNLNKVLKSFRQHRISELHLQSSTGYGYNDIGREGLEEVYADVSERTPW